MPVLERQAPKKRYGVKGVCPHCGRDDTSFLYPDKWREKFMGNREVIDILCPFCGTKHTGTLYVKSTGMTETKKR